MDFLIKKYRGSRHTGTLQRSHAATTMSYSDSVKNRQDSFRLTPFKWGKLLK